jgi:hypothetical protein
LRVTFAPGSELSELSQLHRSYLHPLTPSQSD